MPHIILDHSANLATHLDLQDLCTTLKDAAVETGIFPPAGIRVRSHAAGHSVVADGDPRHCYLDITVRLGAGRSAADKARAADAVFAAARMATAAVMADHPFMLSLELREIDPAYSRKTSSIRDHLPPELH